MTLEGNIVESIIGTWQLQSIELKDESGGTAYPFGRKVKGLVLYQDDGYMAGILSGENRPNVSTPALIGISEPECIAIAKHFNAYAGRYTVQENRIIHNVDVSYVPNLMVEREHVSSFSLADDTLILSSKMPSGVQGHFKEMVITWKRIQAIARDSKE